MFTTNVRPTEGQFNAVQGYGSSCPIVQTIMVIDGVERVYNDATGRFDADIEPMQHTCGMTYVTR